MQKSEMREKTMVFLINGSILASLWLSEFVENKQDLPKYFANYFFPDGKYSI